MRQSTNAIYCRKELFSDVFDDNAVSDGLSEQEFYRLHRRDAFREILDYLASSECSNPAVLFGLRKCGKSVLLLQLAQELDRLWPGSAAYVKVSKDTNRVSLGFDAARLKEAGVRYLLIDEVCSNADVAEQLLPYPFDDIPREDGYIDTRDWHKHFRLLFSGTHFLALFSFARGRGSS